METFQILHPNFRVKFIHPSRGGGSGSAPAATTPKGGQVLMHETSLQRISVLIRFVGFFIGERRVVVVRSEIDETPTQSTTPKSQPTLQQLGCLTPTPKKLGGKFGSLSIDGWSSTCILNRGAWGPLYRFQLVG